jgi:PAS domain S-box-containing protein
VATSTPLESVFDVESFINEYYFAWGGTDEDLILSYYRDDIVLQIPGLLIEGKEALRDQFVRPFITAFPGNHHIVKNMFFGPGVVTVEFSFEARHTGPFAGHAATGTRISLPGCGVYEYDSAKRQITAGRIYFDVGTLLQTITDALVDDRQKSEEALQTNEHNFSQIINAIPTVIGVMRADGTPVYGNQGVTDYTGLTLKDLQSEGFRARIYHPEDLERLSEARRLAFTRPVPFDNEIRILGKDGNYRWFLFRYKPLLDEAGKIDRWYMAAFDIEDRKRAEDAQARQAGVRADVSAAFSKPNHLGEILRGCTEAIVRHLDAAFARIWMLNKNEGMLDLQASAGMYTRLDGSYRRISVGDLKVGLIAREKKAHFTNDVLNDPRVHDKGWAKDNGMIAFAGYPLIVEDRLIGVLALFARHTLSETILETLASVADIIAQGIERKRAEEKVLHSEKILAQAQQLSKTGSFSTDLLADEHNWSEELYRIFELNPGTKITSEAIRALFHPEDLPVYEDAFKRAVDGDHDIDITYRIITPSRNVKHLHAVAQMEMIAGRAVYVGAIQDVTERKVAELALSRARAELAHMARVTTLSELTASISHEINQPIAATITNANACLRWLTRNEPNLEEIRSAVERIRKDGQRTAEIIARLRSLYKKGSPGQHQLVDLNAIVSEMLVLLRTEANSHSIVMRTELAGDLPLVRADRVQLQQVFMNLMLNGIEAMETIKGEMTIRTQLDGSNVLVSISDTGVGLFGHNLDKIFESFFTTKSRGTGMGLSISRSIIEAHGGQLWATNNDARGAIFYFTLPARSAS